MEPVRSTSPAVQLRPKVSFSGSPIRAPIWATWPEPQPAKAGARPMRSKAFPARIGVNVRMVFLLEMSADGRLPLLVACEMDRRLSRRSGTLQDTNRRMRLLHQAGRPSPRPAQASPLSVTQTRVARTRQLRSAHRFRGQKTVPNSKEGQWARVWKRLLDHS